MFLPEPFADAAGEVLAIAFSPNGRLLALAGRGSQQPVLALADVDTGRGVKRLKGHDEGPVVAVAFSPDGSILASGGERGLVVISHVATGKLLEKIAPRKEAPAAALAFAPDGRTLAIGSYAGEIQLRPTQHRRTVGVLHTGARPILALAFAPQGHLVSGEEDGLRYRDATTAKETRLLASGSHRSVSVSSDGKLLAAAAPAGVVAIFDVARGVEVRRIETPGPTCRSVALSGEGTHLLAATEDSFLLYEVATGKELGKFPSPDGGHVFEAVAWSRERSAAACTRATKGVGGTVYLAEDVS